MKRILSATMLTGFVAAATVGAALPAYAADVPTSIVFTAEPSTIVTFGAEWELPVRVSSTSEGTPNIISGSDGTVDFLVEGKPGAFIDDAKIYPGGVAYFTQPANQPLLGVGEYTITAVFTPSPGSDFVTSKTKKSVALTITPLEISPAVAVITDPATVAVPTVRTTITGAYVEEHGAPPAGSWTVAAQDSSGQTVFTANADQPTAATEGSVGPLDIPITAELEPGETFTVTAEFTPDSGISAGLEFENPAIETFTTRSLTPTEVLSSPVAISLWVIILNGVLFVVLIIGLVWLIGGWSRGRTTKERPVAPVEQSTAALASVIDSAPAAIESTDGAATDDADTARR